MFSNKISGLFDGKPCNRLDLAQLGEFLPELVLLWGHGGGDVDADNDVEIAAAAAGEVQAALLEAETLAVLGAGGNL